MDAIKKTLKKQEVRAINREIKKYKKNCFVLVLEDKDDITLRPKIITLHINLCGFIVFMIKIRDL